MTGMPGPVREPFGMGPGGVAVEAIRLGDGAGFAATVLTYGATVQALHVPDREGRVVDVVLGHDTLAPYLAHRRFFGATVGRYANRIARGAFTLDGRAVRLACNDGGNALHGGGEGFDRRMWTLAGVSTAPPSVTLSRTSPDGEEGYPGTLHVSVTFSIPGPATLAMAFAATADAPTVVNLTHHGFFDLSGGVRAGGGGILDHVLTIAADDYLPVDAGAIPLGGPRPVAGTPFDFRTPHAVGARIRDADPQLQAMRGYDHTWCLPGGRTARPRLAATLLHPASGRRMELLTDQPGLQFYSGNMLDGTAAGKGGVLCRQSDALCLEPHAWPDTPNRPGYPSARLDAGETYRHTSIYRFGPG